MSGVRGKRIINGGEREESGGGGGGCAYMKEVLRRLLWWAGPRGIRATAACFSVFRKDKE